MNAEKVKLYVLHMPVYGDKPCMLFDVEAIETESTYRIENFGQLTKEQQKALRYHLSFPKDGSSPIVGKDPFELIGQATGKAIRRRERLREQIENLSSRIAELTGIEIKLREQSRVNSELEPPPF